MIINSAKNLAQIQFHYCAHGIDDLYQLELFIAHTPRCCSIDARQLEFHACHLQPFDDLYLYIMPSFAHEQKAHGG